MSARKTTKQCKACPWRVDVIPARDVPGYEPGLYDRMRATLRDGLDSLAPGTRMSMACHHQVDGEELPCAGWIHNQLGVGNNLAVRINVGSGRLPVPQVIGEQHEILPLYDSPRKRTVKRPGNDRERWARVPALEIVLPVPDWLDGEDIDVLPDRSKGANTKESEHGKAGK